MCAKSRPDSGFTLLEVLVALAIAGLALVLLFRAGGEGLFAVDTAARAEEAVERAQSHLAAVGSDLPLLEGETSGEDGGGYRWQLKITPLARLPALQGSLGPAGAMLFAVEVAVSWAGAGHRREVVLKTQRIAVATGSGR